uniref:Uncharacterized protein n=1 Tax=Panagrolaimus superbus TaxID=310955 RepID=A0A914XZ83_9BILA
MHNQILSKKIKEINQQNIVAHIKYCASAFVQELKNTGEKKLETVPIFFISSYTLRSLMKGKEPPTAVYQEQQLMEYIKTKSKYSRNIVF